MEVYRRARIFDGYVDAINATDGSGANCHMSSMAVCALLTRVGYAPVMQISCRDKKPHRDSRRHTRRRCNGRMQHPCLERRRRAFRRPSPGQAGIRSRLHELLEIGCAMRDEHRFQSGRKITFAPRVFFGAAENPFARPYEWRPHSTGERKWRPARNSSKRNIVTTCRCSSNSCSRYRGSGLARQSVHPDRRRSACVRLKPPNGCAPTFPESTFPTPIVQRMAKEPKTRLRRDANYASN
jgi:hypothetical protein